MSKHERPVRLSVDHPYGDDSPNVGRPCLLNGKMGVIYGCNVRKPNDHYLTDILGVNYCLAPLTVLYLDDGNLVKVAVDVDERAGQLTIIKPGSRRGRQIVHRVIAAIVEQFLDLERRRNDVLTEHRSWD